MNLRDKAKNPAQQPSEVAATDVKLTVNLHFSSINVRGEYLVSIDSFERHLKGNIGVLREFSKTCCWACCFGTRSFGKVLRFSGKQFCKQ